MNSKLVLLSSGVAMALGATVVLARSALRVRPAIPFEKLSLTLEINATDIDAGVVFSSDSDEAIEHLAILNPSNQVIYEATSSDPEELGLTEVFWETAEPDIQTALLAYPEGQYTVMAEGFDGTPVTGVVNLSHAVPDGPVLTSPGSGDVVNIHHVEVAWVLDSSVDHYWLEFEQDDPPVEFTIEIQPGSSSFRIPAELMRRGTEYKVGLGAVGSNGNVTVSEVEFETR